MNNKLIAMFCFAVLTTSVVAETEINCIFKPGKSGVPFGWVQDKCGRDKLFGRVEVINDGILKITTENESTNVYMSKQIKVKVGDTVEISLQVKGKGKGKGRFGFYNYGSEKRWLGVSLGNFAVKTEYSEVKKKLRVEQKQATIEGKKVSVDPRTIRIVLIAGPESEIMYKDLKVKVISSE